MACSITPLLSLPCVPFSIVGGGKREKLNENLKYLIINK